MVGLHLLVSRDWSRKGPMAPFPWMFARGARGPRAAIRCPLRSMVMLSPGAESWQERMEQERSQGTQRNLLSAHKGRAMLILFVPLYPDPSRHAVSVGGPPGIMQDRECEPQVPWLRGPDVFLSFHLLNCPTLIFSHSGLLLL